MKIEVKNVKTLESMSGIAFSANVYFDGKKAGTVDNSGRGGPNRYNPRSIAKIIRTQSDNPDWVEAEDTVIENCLLAG